MHGVPCYARSFIILPALQHGSAGSCAGKCRSDVERRQETSSQSGSPALSRLVVRAAWRRPRARDRFTTPSSNLCPGAAGICLCDRTTPITTPTDVLVEPVNSPDRISCAIACGCTRMYSRDLVPLELRSVPVTGSPWRGALRAASFGHRMRHDVLIDGPRGRFVASCARTLSRRRSLRFGLHPRVACADHPRDVRLDPRGGQLSAAGGLTV